MATVTNYDLFEDLFHFIKNPDVEISDVIKEHGGSSQYIPSYKTNIRNDEICEECPKELTQEVVKATKHFMETIGAKYCHRLPLPAEEEIGPFWKH